MNNIMELVKEFEKEIRKKEIRRVQIRKKNREREDIEFRSRNV